MNTRLPVEHPVTEAITGLDLVELMIRVAAGEKLPLTQAQVQRNGWAIECRINAEDPFRNFLPSTGRLVRFAPPAQTMFQGNTQDLLGVRVDTGVHDGGEIPMFYDSMIAKLIVHGSDRLDAIAKMREALNGFVIRGVSSNIPFQAALLAHPKFVAGDFNTGFIAENYAHGFRAEDVPHQDAHFLTALAAFVRRKSRERTAGISGQLPGYGVEAGKDYVVIAMSESGKHVYTPVHVDEFVGETGSARVRVADAAYEIRSRSRLNDIVIVGTVNGKAFTAQIERGTPKNPLALRVQHNGTRIDALVVSPRMAALHQLMPFKSPPDMSRFVLSPMPGLLSQVLVAPGQKVQAGERVAVIEAMKMENVLFAAADGVVKKVAASQGESLTVDQMIVEFEA
jgi:propionyl-CoA carboxylase alpha chain